MVAFSSPTATTLALATVVRLQQARRRGRMEENSSITRSNNNNNDNNGDDRKTNAMKKFVNSERRGRTSSSISSSTTETSTAQTDDRKEATRRLLQSQDSMIELPLIERNQTNRVMGCASQTWVKIISKPSSSKSAEEERNRVIEIKSYSDSAITRGFLGLLTKKFEGYTLKQIIEDVHVESIVNETLRGVSESSLKTSKIDSRQNGFKNALETIKRQARSLLNDFQNDPFPSLIVTKSGCEPKGSFAEAQAKYLTPDDAQVEMLAKLLIEKKCGIVAHFYMDPEVQGVLMRCKAKHPECASRIFISDSLVMADAAVRMVRDEKCENVCVLGVDFMSENVRAIIDDAGFPEANVYRMSPDAIGCSLAEAAQTETYEKYLREAGKAKNSLHVIYINTGLDTKASANAKVPTISCTSSNVVNTVLQAAAQIPDIKIFYGPDTYMGGNLVELLTRASTTWSDEEIKELHPEHNQKSVKRVLENMEYFRDGACVVHHLFGGEVCRVVRDCYSDAYQAAHFEVPGEMFTLAMEARERNMGVVGSTQNILDFILAKIRVGIEKERISREFFSAKNNCTDYSKQSEEMNEPYVPERMKFVLGTETGMVTSIVRAVSEELEKNDSSVECEIIFPVSVDSITQVKNNSTYSGKIVSNAMSNLSIIPGPASGEGCGMDGGCASCPYMKMNSLAALRETLEMIGSGNDKKNTFGLELREPKKYKGNNVAKEGCVSILHMRNFQRDKKLGDDLIQDILSR
jgi:quinolinate synthase